MPEPTALSPGPAAHLTSHQPLWMRRIAWCTLLLLAAVAGVRAALLPESADPTGGATLLAIAIALTTAVWCLFDGRVRGTPVPTVLIMLVFIALPIGLPIHFLWSRGARGVLFAIAFVGTFLAVLFAAGMTAEFVADRQGP